MGLAERRALKEFQDNTFPGLQSQIKASAGFDVELEIDWNAVAEEGMSHMYGENLPKVYFEPLIEGLKAICADQMGKEALQQGLKKIVITNQQGNYNGDHWASFENGVLKLDHQPNSNVDYVNERTRGLVSTLESAL